MLRCCLLKNCLLTVICSLASGITFSQPYYFRHYGVENGLSHNTVFCSLQDKQGFMWFGTKDGLNRFDGYRFKLFHTNTSKTSDLSIDYIFSLAVDAQGTLWVGGKNGLFHYDVEHERLVRTNDTLNQCSNLVIDKAGWLWFTAGTRLLRYHPLQKKWDALPSMASEFVTSICPIPDGRIGLALSDGRIAFWRGGKLQSTHDVFAHSPTPASRWISKLAYDDNGKLYVGTSSQGLKEFDLATQTTKDLLTANGDKTTIYVRDIVPVRPNELWLATESGLFLYNPITQSATNLRKNYLDPYSLSDNAVYTLFKDRENGLWAGTFFGGLNYYPKQNLLFQKFFPGSLQNGIAGSAVREICEDGKGNLWIGTEDAGLNKLNLKTGEITPFFPNGSSASIDYPNIHGLLVNNGQLWIGTFEHGLDIMDIQTGRVLQRYKAGNGAYDLRSNFVVTFLKTRSGEIYLGTSNSLAKWTGIDGKFVHLDSICRNAFIVSLFEDRRGTIWIGTNDRGLFYFNPTNGLKGRFENDPLNENSLPTNSINAMHEDGRGNLWLAMEGGGLCRLSNDRKTFQRYTTRNGLPSNVVFKVLEDNNGHLWATTSKGLVTLNPSNNRVKVYTKENGLLNDQFNYNSGYKDATGKLYFGSVRGMITFYPSEKPSNHFSPPVFITGIQVHNKELDVEKDSNVLSKSIVCTDNIRLSHDQSSFSIDFAALSFASPEVTEYRYKMEGLDNDWTYLKTNRKVYFTNLQPGTYTFKVKAAVNGICNKAETRLTVYIAPPFWATWWAYGIYVLCAAFLLYYILRTYHKIHMNNREKEIYEAKIDFFTNVAHELKTPLTLIKGPVENLSEMTESVPEISDDVRTLNRNTARLVNLVNQIMDFRQTEAKNFSLDFTPVNFNELLQEVYVTFEPLAKKKSLQYTINLPPAKIVSLADDEALTKIFSNLFGNAVKYSGKLVHIDLQLVQKTTSYLQVTISNDGAVIPAGAKEKIFEPFYRLKQSGGQKGTGIGLTLARSLAELHNGQLFMEIETEELNVFILRLPYTPVREPVITVKRLQS